MQPQCHNERSKGKNRLIAIFNLVKLKSSKDIFDSSKCKVTFGFKYIIHVVLSHGVYYLLALTNMPLQQCFNTLLVSRVFIWCIKYNC